MTPSTRETCGRQPGRRSQTGNTVILVLILLTVMIFGTLAMARISEISTLASGNVATADAALQASEVGLNTGFAALRALTSEDTAVSGWYWPTTQAADAAGIPNVNWDGAPEVAVGNYRVRYVAERLCSVTPATDILRQCLVKPVPQTESNREGAEAPDPPNARQFRVTVRAVGPKGTQVWTQALVTRGS